MKDTVKQLEIETLVDDSGNIAAYWARGHVDKEEFARLVNWQWDRNFVLKDVLHGRASLSSDAEDLHDLPDFCEYSFEFGVRMIGDRTIEATYLEEAA